MKRSSIQKNMGEAMKTVIIVDPNEVSRRRQVNVASRLGCELVSASRLEDVEPAHYRRSPSVVVGSEALGVHNLLRLIAEPVVQANLIVVGRDHVRNGTDLERFAQVLDTRWNDGDLTRSLIDALKTPVEIGSLRLIDTLRDLHEERHTARLVIDSVPASEIAIVQGELVHAERGDLQGLSALKHIIARPGGPARVLPILSIPKTIEGEFHRTLLDILRQLEDARHGP